MVLDGMVPVLTHTPPTTDRDSTTATRFFIFDAATAARCPEGPEPMTTRSYLAALMRVSPWCKLRTKRGAEHGGGSSLARHSIRLALTWRGAISGWELLLFL